MASFAEIPDFARDIGSDVHNFHETERALDHRLANEGTFAYADTPGGFEVPHTRGTLAELQNAFGHWAEHAGPDTERFEGDAAFMKQWDGASEDERSQHLSSHHIHDHYVDSADGLAKLTKHRDFDMSSVEGRLEAVNNLTQVNKDDPMGNTTCAASSLVAAAMLNGGKSGSEGIEKLMAAMDHERGLHADAKLEEGSSGEDAIRKEIARAKETGEPLKLSSEVMQRLQRDLYTEMHMVQGKTTGKQITGLTTETMQSFVNDNKDFHQMMVDSHMSIASIDCVGGKGKDGFGPHATLQIGDAHGGTAAVYDPWARDAGQLVTDKSDLFDYANAKLRDPEHPDQLEPEVQ